MTKTQVFFTTSFTLLISSTLFAQERLYLNPDTGPMPVYSRPGQNDEACDKSQNDCQIYLNPDTQITKILNANVTPVEEIDARGRVSLVHYVKVQYQIRQSVTIKDKKGKTQIKDELVTREGWMNASQLYTQPIESSWKSRHILKNPDFRADSCMQGVKSQHISMGQIQPLNEANSEIAHQALDESVEKLKDVIGQCPLKPAKRKTEFWKDKEVYETEALPLLQRTLKKIKLALPKMVKDNQVTSATSEDIYNIDVLARTIYAEMAECLQESPEYGKAVAKVALNRESLVKKGTAFQHFTHTRTGQKRALPELGQVLLAKNQFSLWNVNTGPKDQSILLALCPARDNSDQNWSNQRASPRDQIAWENALKIATEAVLFRPAFESKTKQITQFYFTSKMAKYDGRTRAEPKIIVGNRYKPINNSNCLTLWNGK